MGGGLYLTLPKVAIKRKTKPLWSSCLVLTVKKQTKNSVVFVHNLKTRVGSILCVRDFSGLVKVLHTLVFSLPLITFNFKS